MDNKEFMDKVLAAHGLTDKPVKFDGKWVYPSEFRKPVHGDVLLDHKGIAISISNPTGVYPFIVCTPCTLPPKPTAEDIKRLTPYGKVITVADEPDLESVPYVSCQLIAPLMEHRNGITPFDKFHGLRYGVTIKDAPVVEYWRSDACALCKTIDGIIVEHSSNMFVGTKLDMPELWQSLTEAEYLAAIKPEVVKTCEHDWQGLECAKCGQPKPEQVKEIEQLPDFHMWDNPSEVVDAINRLNKAVNELRKGKV